MRLSWLVRPVHVPHHNLFAIYKHLTICIHIFDYTYQWICGLADRQMLACGSLKAVISQSHKPDQGRVQSHNAGSGVGHFDRNGAPPLSLTTAGWVSQMWLVSGMSSEGICVKTHSVPVSCRVMLGRSSQRSQSLDCASLTRAMEMLLCALSKWPKTTHSFVA